MNIVNGNLSKHLQGKFPEFFNKLEFIEEQNNMSNRDFVDSVLWIDGNHYVSIIYTAHHADLTKASFEIGLHSQKLCDYFKDEFSGWLSNSYLTIEEVEKFCQKLAKF